MVKLLDTWTKNRRTGLRAPAVRAAALAAQPAPQQAQPAAAVQPAAVSGLDASKLALCVDVSHWQGAIDWTVLKAGGVAMAFIKASDGKPVREGDPTQPKYYVDTRMRENVQGCFEVGMPCGLYHYVQPFFADYTVKGTIDWNWTCMLEAVRGLTPGKSYHAYVLDVEERTGSDPNRSDVVLGLIERIKKDPLLSQVPLVIYTSMSVLNSYYVKLREQTSFQGAEFNFWLAQWVFSTPTSTSWETLRANYIPKIDMRVMTPGWATWQFLQWAACFALPGCAGRMDLDFFKGDAAALYAWLGYQPAQPGDPGDPGDPGEPPAGSVEARLAALEAWRAAIAGVSG